MKTSYTFGLTTMAAMTLVVLSACGGGGGGDAPATAGWQSNGSVSVQFAAVQGSTPVTCATPLTGLGVSGTKQATLKDLRFYVGNLALLKADGSVVPVQLAGNAWQVQSSEGTVALVDLEDASNSCQTQDGKTTAQTNARISGTVPAGQYVGVQATIGVPGQLNHSAIAGGVAPLDNAAMAWSWQSGRKFMKVEVDPEGGMQRTDAAGVVTTLATYNMHLGATGCTAQKDTAGNNRLDAAGNTLYTCASPNQLPLKFASFDPAKQAIALDVRALFAGVDFTRDGGGAAGCMSGATDPECAAIFQNLGLNLTAEPRGQLAAGSNQVVFKAIAQ